MANKIQIRRDTAANWTSANPTLSQGEQGYETDTGKLKIGDGSTAWTSLGYSFGAGGDTGIDFDDNVKARFGTGNDLEIYHNGTSSIIENTSAGQYLRIRSAGGIQFTTSGTENALVGIQDNKVGLYYDGSEKLETTSTGIQTTGTVNVNGAYTLPTSDGTNGQVLTTDGAGAVTFADAGGGSLEVLSKTDSYTISTDDDTKLIVLTSGVSKTFTLPSASTAGAGWHVKVHNVSGNELTVSRSGSDTVNNGDSSYKIGSGAGASFVSDGTSEWYLTDKSLYLFAEGNRNNGSYDPTATGLSSIAIGRGANASGQTSLALGTNASFGGSQALGTSSVALAGSYASGNNSLAAVIENNTSTYGSTQVSAIAMGSLAKASQSYSVALGRAAQATGGWSYALGQAAAASGTPSHVLGHNSSASAANSISIGSSITNSTSNQIVLGGTAQTVKISDTYTLPTSDGTNGQVLTTNGAGAVTFADAGGGADLYAANESLPTAQPSATGINAVAIGDQAIASGDDSLAFGEHSDATATRSFSFGFGATATHTGALALGTSRAFSGDAVAIGIDNNSTSYGASGANSIAMGQNAKATQTNAFGVGYLAQATGQYNIAIGGYQTQATGTYHSLGLGSNVSSTAFASTAINGGNIGSDATADWSVSIGGGALSNIIGKFAYSSAGAFGVGATGDAQQGTYVLRSDTTDATAEAMTTNNSTAGTTNQIILPNNSAYSFSGTIIARQDATSGSNYASWEIKGALLRDGTAASTVLGNGIVNKLYATAGASTWAVALSADTTNGGLKVEVTGAAATNIRWVATVNTSEVTYA